MRTEFYTRRWSQPREMRAISLIEVVAATVLLGTAVTILLSMQSNSLERMQTLDRDLMAGELANELYIDWRLNSKGVKEAAYGSIEGHPDWTWRREFEPVTVAQGVEADRVTLTLLYENQSVFGMAYERAFQWLDHRGNEN